jgi:hypothetical protein
LHSSVKRMITFAMVSHDSSVSGKLSTGRMVSNSCLIVLGESHCRGCKTRRTTTLYNAP